MNIFIPDIHNKWPSMENAIDKLIDEHDVSRIIVMGDLVDDWNSTDSEQIESLQRFINWHEQVTTHTPVTVLGGNHCFAYLAQGDEAKLVQRRSMGYRKSIKKEMKEMLSSLPLQIATIAHTTEGDAIVSHAGITRQWLKEVAGVNFILPDLSSTGDGSEFIFGPDTYTQIVDGANNVLERGDWQGLLMCNPERGGWHPYSSPLWAGLNEIRFGNPVLWQIVGHTPVPSITDGVWGGARLTCVDTWSTYPDDSPIGDRSFLVV